LIAGTIHSVYSKRENPSRVTKLNMHTQPTTTVIKKFTLRVIIN